MNKVLQRDRGPDRDANLKPSKRENLLSEAELDQVAGAQNRGRPNVNTSGG
jgi:hypothetical protein